MGLVDYLGPPDHQDVGFLGPPEHQGGLGFLGPPTPNPQSVGVSQQGGGKPDDAAMKKMQKAIPGILRPGTIDLENRPPAYLENGDIAPLRAFTISTPQGEALIPTVVNGRVVGNDEAIRHFQETGQHLGYFRNKRAAHLYAQRLHHDQYLTHVMPQLQKTIKERRKHGYSDPADGGGMGMAGNI